MAYERAGESVKATADYREAVRLAVEWRAAGGTWSEKWERWVSEMRGKVDSGARA